MGGHVARIGEPGNAYSILVGKPEGKRPLVRPRCRFEDNIRLDSSGSGQGPVADTCEYGNEPLTS
jgi:hypothetical protein